MVLSRTLVLGELKFSCTPSSLRLFLSHTIDYFAFMEQLPLPLWHCFHSNVKLPGSTVHATQGV
jgi:hypothetical protein